MLRSLTDAGARCPVPGTFRESGNSLLFRCCRRQLSRVPLADLKIGLERLMLWSCVG